ncbi:MAG: YdeI/OmpD-associated family protein, partial [Myxococcales bacterium]
ERSRTYSYERAQASLAPEQEKQLRRNRKAWTYFEARPPWYRKAAIHWVVSAKQEVTRQKRLQTLIDDSAAGQHVKPLRRPAKR